MGRGPKPAKSKEAKPSVARKSPKSDGARVRDLEKRLAEALKGKAEALGQLQTRDRELVEALDRQTATAEILRVISESQTDVQPVFEAIADSAMRLFRAWSALVFRYDGELLSLAAARGGLPGSSESFRARFQAPRRPDDDTIHGRTVITRSVQHIADVEADAYRNHHVRRSASERGFRSVVWVPMLRGNEAVGAIGVSRVQSGGFSDAEIALLQTFADQAVIAIENVRVFKELQQKNEALTVAHAQVTESLEQQTATSDILRAIASSPTDVQPVFDTVAESAASLCKASDTSIFRLDGDRLRRVAHRGSIPAGVIGEFTVPLVRGSFAGRCVLDGRIVHIADGQTEANEFPEGSEFARRLGFRAILLVPLVREGVALGVITLRRTEPRLFTDRQVSLLQTFADQAVIAIENVRLFNETKEALEQQTATANILRVISSSPTDVQPVFDAIVRSATLLCGAMYGTAIRFDGELLHLAASYNHTPEVDRLLRQAHPMRPSPRTMAGRAILAGDVAQVEDALDDRDYMKDVAQAGGFRSMLAAPLLRDGRPIGAIVVNRGQPGPFSRTHIDLLKTFADQAVIAIENVRLFTELQEKNQALTAAHAQVTEALEQQTATAEILRVISSSPTDVQPVFDTIVERAARLCSADDAVLLRVDGDVLTLVAHLGTVQVTPEHLAMPITRGMAVGQAVLDRRTVHIHDMAEEHRRGNYPASVDLRQRVGYRTLLIAPLVREDVAIGAIVIRRLEVRDFSESQIALLQTFADQAVIAIENVRLFKELEARNNELTTALDTQTATSDILRVISRSQADVQPVFDAIVRSAVKLCDGFYSLLVTSDGEMIHLRATYNMSPQARRELERVHPMAVRDGSTSSAVAVRDGRTVHIADLQQDPEISLARRQRAIAVGHRTFLSVPMLREGVAIGAIAVSRREVKLFTESEIALLQIFADQAVIAIENTRLLGELQARTAELTQSVGELRALAEVSRAVSSTLDLDAVLETIVAHANELAGSDGCTIWEYDDLAEEFSVRARSYTNAADAAGIDAARGVRLRKTEGVVGRAALTRVPVQIPDITMPGTYESPMRAALVEAGYRAMLAVPLLREDAIYGGLVVSRKAPGEFSADVVELLKNFATQSVLAIQNARLFREIEDKSRELEVASRHKSEFLANMSHELRTPLNAIIGFSEVLSEKMFGELNEKQEEYSKDIHASGQHLLSLINDILDLSKIEAGRMELELTNFDLPQAIDNALTLVRERASRRGIALHQSVAPHLGEITGDERKVKQVLLNLLSNALKFTPEGGRVEVLARVIDGMAEISVTDTGVGIAPEDQEAVFEEFRQVGTAEKKVEGTGLGLTLCRKFVELNGGKIWVTSQVGVGSTFTFTIPVRSGK